MLGASQLGFLYPNALKVLQSFFQLAGLKKFFPKIKIAWLEKEMHIVQERVTLAVVYENITNSLKQLLKHFKI
ncbi:hypothetical protein [Candidatus Protochlamydia amoebophila]|uniref:Uncharacterized protein n=2 Tax=Candidatus Protochlamydia amoebophila TaxID=362787 RepID=A0A2P9HAG2_PARUW|nr:hypothetical protein [Candidatus Protochlamydia amoebophila]KIC70736.1 hypothetical protein DB44_GD00110 [Candidatus Protochlamydia amoebophila]SPJ31983.1 unnamed protein product [Candidatus Protochlamydia amoebophila UWE25]